jgi:prepilin-type processing-associated H-X9-DG protein
MNTERWNIFSFFLLAMSFFFLIFGIYFPLQERKKQMICQARLCHWGTAFQMYYYQNNKSWTRSSHSSPESWVLQIQANLYSNEVISCPSEQKGYGYKIAFVPPTSSFFAPSPDTVVMFDGVGDQTRIDFQKNISRRHLNKANFLRLDGSVFLK